jgi:hypothetical protein
MVLGFYWWKRESRYTVFGKRPKTFLNSPLDESTKLRFCVTAGVGKDLSLLKGHKCQRYKPKFCSPSTEMVIFPY